MDRRLRPPRRRQVALEEAVGCLVPVEEAVGCSGDWVANPTQRTPTGTSSAAPPPSGAQHQCLQVKVVSCYMSECMLDCLFGL